MPLALSMCVQKPSLKYTSRTPERLSAAPPVTLITWRSMYQLPMGTLMAMPGTTSNVPDTLLSVVMVEVGGVLSTATVMPAEGVSMLPT